MKIFEYKDPTVENGKYVIFEMGNAENVNPIEFYRNAYIQKQIAMYWAISPNLKKEFAMRDLELSKADLEKLFEKRSISDWEEFYAEKSKTEISQNYLNLLKTSKKAEQQKLLKEQTISTYELFAFIMHAYKEFGLKFSQYIFNHTQKGIDQTDLTDFTHLKEDGTIVTSRETELTNGQLKQAIEHRVVMVAKFIGDEKNWHCFFTNYKSLKGKEKAYKNGQAHFHYISDKWGLSKEEVISELSKRKYKLPSMPHLDISE
jgi:hypothetical protein